MIYNKLNTNTANPKTTICLNMIVKNEAHIIERCLNLAKKFIDYWVIIDTGSTDGTQELIKKFLHDIPGELLERPWVDFAYNRNEALEAARSKGDYLFILDADDELIFAPNFVLPRLTADCYLIEIKKVYYSMMRANLIKNNLAWRYKGVIHEVLDDADIPYKIKYENLSGLVIQSFPEGNRAKNANRHLDDIATLKKALQKDPDNLNYIFILGQYAEIFNKPQEALEYFTKVITKVTDKKKMQYQYWYSLIKINDIKQQLKYSWGEVLNGYICAYNFLPQHPYPLFMISQYYQQRSEYSAAYLFLKQAVLLPKVLNIAFISNDIYYFIQANFVCCAIKVNDFSTAKKINIELLNDVKLPYELKELVDFNNSMLMKNDFKLSR